MKIKWLSLPVAGIAAIVIYILFTVVAYFRYPGSYGPSSNWLSDLGNPLVNPSGAIYYNLGCILTGLELNIFYSGLSQWNTGDKKMRVLLAVAQTAGVIASFSLVFAALFPLGTHTAAHEFWSKMISVFMGFFLTFSATALLKHRAFIRWFGYYAFFAAAVNFTYGVFLHSVYLAEWISIGMFIVYVFMVAYNSRSLGRSR